MKLKEFYKTLGARFGSVNGAEVVADYGDKLAEHAALWGQAGVLDLSFRSRVCLTGSDRIRFLHGQVTNDIKRMGAGEGCYAALVTAKGRMESDLNIYCLADEVLLDFEPGLAEKVSKRLESFIVADDVQVIEVASLYGLLSVQGPQAEAVVRKFGVFQTLPAGSFQILKSLDPVLGEMYLANQPRLGTRGYDLFVPVEGLTAAGERLLAAVRESGGRVCGWEAFELARIEAGIPRFGADMDETNLPQECGIEARAVSYTKGCYIGQEVLNRIHTIGHVNRAFCGLRLAENLPSLPSKGDRLSHDGKEVGMLTSTVRSPALGANIALGYVRREASRVGSELVLKTLEGESRAQVVSLPFVSV